MHVGNLMPIKALAWGKPITAITRPWMAIVNPGLRGVDIEQIGLGYALTRKAIDQNLFIRQFGLPANFQRTKEYFAASILDPIAFPISPELGDEETLTPS